MSATLYPLDVVLTVDWIMASLTFVVGDPNKLRAEISQTNHFDFNEHKWKFKERAKESWLKQHVWYVCVSPYINALSHCS